MIREIYQGFWSPALLFLGFLTQAQLAPSHCFLLCRLCSCRLSSPYSFSPNSSFSLKLSSLPFHLNLSKPVSLKLSLLRIQRLNRLFLIIPELKKAIVKDCTKVTEDSHWFAEEFNIIIQTYQPGFSDLYQLVLMCVKARPSIGWKLIVKILKIF